MWEEEIEELHDAEIEDALANPSAYGLDEDNFPNVEEFNAAISEVAAFELDVNSREL